VTLLIFGMGARLLPGFLGREHLASPRLVWATFWLGNAAALLRVGPLLVPWLLALAGGSAPPPATGLLALSGLLDTLAVAAFGWNLWRTFR
jgi:heme/copper-type cytochrome/quinol oxidase subunit 1